MADELSPTEYPFGETDTTVAELKKYVDLETAEEVLLEQSLPDPDARLNEFVARVPALLHWLEENGREYPWRNTGDPWRIYLAEILLQRTRADAVEDVYTPFFSQFSDAARLKMATDEEIRSVIDSLGFGNQRTRTLNEVAELIDHEYSGTVPRSLEALQRPWRVGPYSARATMMFAFGEPLALVDTNFARVVERVFDYEMPAQPHKSDTLYELLDALIPGTGGLCRSFNLALLDLAAAICTPSVPACGDCPLAPGCSYAQNSGPDL